ncbi:MAG: PAS domain S-box protein [Candidatus Limnocylindria bacterium]
MDDLRDRLIRGDLVQDVRALLQRGAEDHGQWLRENLRHALVARQQDAVAVSALTGVAPGTVRGFLNGRPSSIHNVLLMAEAIGYTLAELDRPPDEFRQRVDARGDSADGGAIGASLLAFDQSPTAMAIILLDGTIVKVNRQLLELLGYAEGELIGAPAATFSVSSDEDQAERRDEMAATDAIRARVTQLRRKDGALVSAVTSALVVRDEEGEPRYVIARAAPTPAASD